MPLIFDYSLFGHRIRRRWQREHGHRREVFAIARTLGGIVQQPYLSKEVSPEEVLVVCIRYSKDLSFQCRELAL